MTKEELQDSVEILSEFTEMLKHRIDNQDYAKAWEIIPIIRYRVTVIDKGIEDIWCDKIRQETKDVRGEGND